MMSVNCQSMYWVDEYGSRINRESRTHRCLRYSGHHCAASCSRRAQVEMTVVDPWCNTGSSKRASSGFPNTAEADTPRTCHMSYTYNSQNDCRLRWISALSTFQRRASRSVAMVSDAHIPQRSARGEETRTESHLSRRERSRGIALINDLETVIEGHSLTLIPSRTARPMRAHRDPTPLPCLSERNR